MLVDEIWHGVGDGASDLDWYVKRTILGGVYSTTEIYMLTDDSLGWFLVPSVGCIIAMPSKKLLKV